MTGETEGYESDSRDERSSAESSVERRARGLVYSQNLSEESYGPAASGNDR